MALYISTAILGGLVFQLPTGRLSDRLDRRALAACLLLTALALALVGDGPGDLVSMSDLNLLLHPVVRFASLRSKRPPVGYGFALTPM
jgi:MFS family permease